jgi:hypothetical protein
MTDIIRRPGQPYRTDNINLHYFSSLTNEEAEKLIGKQIERVEASKYNMILFFTDGSKFTVSGFSRGPEGIDSLDTKLDEPIIKIE